MNATVQDTQGAASPKRLARIAGVLYLIVAIFAAFSYNVATPTVYVPGDAAATAQRVMANAGLLRAGVVADLVQATAWIFVAMVFYLLLRHVNENWARAMVILVAVGATIICLSEVFPVAALLVATGESYVTAFGAAGSNALALLLLDIHHYGIVNASVFFGLWLIPLGLLAYRSGMFPKALGVLLVVGGVCYPVGVLAVYLTPAFGEAVKTLLINVPTVAEVWLLGYLLVDRGEVLAPGHPRGCRGLRSVHDIARGFGPRAEKKEIHDVR
jgi:hypothetical protein